MTLLCSVLCDMVSVELCTGGGPVLGRSNVYTYRSPGYMLSSVQDYHGGQTAGQQQAWQLTLEPSQVTGHQ